MPRKDPRPIRVEGDVAFIPLTKGHTAIIDASDLPLVEGYNWIAMPGRHCMYAMRKARISEGALTRPAIMLHRLIANPPSGMVVDHINGDGLDNRRSNLRVVTYSENSRNCFHHRDRTNTRSLPPGKTGHRGIYHLRGEYVARLDLDGARFDVAHGEDLEEVVRAREWYCARLNERGLDDAALGRFVRELFDGPSIGTGAALAALRRAAGPVE